MKIYESFEKNISSKYSVDALAAQAAIRIPKHPDEQARLLSILYERLLARFPLESAQTGMPSKIFQDFLFPEEDPLLASKHR